MPPFGISDDEIRQAMIVGRYSIFLSRICGRHRRSGIIADLADDRQVAIPTWLLAESPRLVEARLTKFIDQLDPFTNEPGDLQLPPIL
jgi:hypothetical protein